MWPSALRLLFGKSTTAQREADAILDADGLPRCLPLPLPQRQFVFFHIPKSGGTAVATYLRNRYAGCRIVNYDHMANYCKDTLDRPGFTESIDLIHGHVPFSFLKRLRNSPFLFSIAREPVDRILSHYFYLRMGTSGMEAFFPGLVEAAMNLPLEDFVRCDHPHVLLWTRNFMTRQLADDHLNLDSLDDAGCLNRAVENLTAFEHIGLHEDMITSLNILQYAMGWEITDHLEEVNKTSERLAASDVSPDLQKTIRRRNADDVALYNIIRQRHHESASAMRPLIGRRRQAVASLIAAR